jgi:hypothetical protein
MARREVNIEVQHALVRMERRDLAVRLKEIYYAGLERKPGIPDLAPRKKRP